MRTEQSDMCEQCTTDSEYILEFAPNWHLVRAKRDGEYMKSGELGLVRSNDPDFVFPVDPVEAPREANGKIDWNSPNWDEFWEIYELCLESFACEPIVGYDLVKACKMVGFEERSGFNFAHFNHWLFDYLAKCLNGFRPEIDSWDR